ncbi:MAG: glycerate kinase [Acidimicrobiales bacterium]
MATEANRPTTLPRVVAAPDKYRGTLSALQAAEAIAEGARRAGRACDVAPVSDGGEGFLEVFSGVATRQVARVDGPLGWRVDAEWLLGRDTATGRAVAVLESARAIGLGLVGGPSHNDPVGASSAGAGHLVRAALRAGAQQVLVGMGGSATTDGGLGAVEVLARPALPARAEIVVACDVETLFLEAASVFSPQKGATPAQAELLKRRLERVAQLYRQRFGVDVTALRGAGAAGGLAGGLAALGARLVPGFQLVAERLSLAERVAGAALVVTGEGCLDQQSFTGKAVGGVAELARAAGVPLLVVAGDVDPHLAGPSPERAQAGTEPPGLWPRSPASAWVSLVRRYGRRRAFHEPAACIAEVVAERLLGAPGAPAPAGRGAERLAGETRPT